MAWQNLQCLECGRASGAKPAENHRPRLRRRILRVRILAFNVFAWFYAQRFFVIQGSTPTLPDEMLLKPPQAGYSPESLKYNDMNIEKASRSVSGVLFNSFEAFEPTLRK
ncbi:hypothetical protein RvY_04166 [Ramazzottius varieornatus]|uniref:Uncharacterized protein n=1 Tax=Ramazzottius varieornatus TaxID=947166 RepID=A0A1D1UQM9_RAMVA|nr:hypothetical protein RvY_04166 [Ramazzottius varieornatus]